MKSNRQMDSPYFQILNRPRSEAIADIQKRLRFIEEKETDDDLNFILNLHHRVKRFFASVALTLLHSDRLRR